MSLMMMFLSFCGGVFGAMLGGLGSFIMVGLMGLIGIVLAVTGVDFDWIGIIAFGPFFGPHISFGAGAAAAAYAKMKGYTESGKDIVTGLMTLDKMDVLFVGGLFGVFANLVAYGVGFALPGKVDNVAVAVVVLAFTSKLLFTGELISPPKDKCSRFGCCAEDTWVPYMRSVSQQTIIALTVGPLAAYVTMLMLQDPKTAGVAGLVGFCISAFSILFAYVGVGIPITHHITVCASYGVIASGGNFVWGIAGALMAALIADSLSRVFHCNGDVHVDPPALGISTTSLLLLGVLPAIGVFDLIWLPYVLIAASVAYGFIEGNRMKKKNAALEVETE
jgi:hypothetical protein